MPTRFDDYVPPPGYQGSNPQPPTPFYENGGWDTVEVDKNLEAPYYAGSWNARAHYDANDPPAASAPRKSEGGPVPNPGTIDVTLPLSAYDQMYAAPEFGHLGRQLDQAEHLQQNNYPWDRPQGPGGIYYKNGTASLLGALLGEYASLVYPLFCKSPCRGRVGAGRSDGERSEPSEAPHQRGARTWAA
ncbi:MAG: hypothetical protein KF847_08120 [Pirellulales bacterium]|nr:hypothetical protein [Pirellulales bacterium]